MSHASSYLYRALAGPYLPRSLSREFPASSFRFGAPHPMDEEQVIDLFEIYWFYHNTPAKPSSPPPTPPKSDSYTEEPRVSRLQTLHRRSYSDQSLGLSPNFVLPATPKLDTIFSGREAAQSTEKTADPVLVTRSKKAAGLRLERRQKKKMSKSLSDLEFEELKGLMDLGFTFPETEVDSRLMSIVPGLQRRGRSSGEEETEMDERAVSRPYLSEAWLVGREEEDPLANWKISAMGDGVDMKNQLRSWAHAVASTVR